MRELKRDAVFLEHAKAEKTEEKEKARRVIPGAAASLDLTAASYLKLRAGEAISTVRRLCIYSIIYPQHSYSQPTSIASRQ